MNLWSTFLDLDKLHESTYDKRWTDQALDELKNKPKSDWTADDWDTFHYCKNANAERDYYDSLDEDFYDFEPVNTNSWVKMPPAQNSTVANKAYVNKALAPSSVYVVSTRKAADLQQPDFCEFEQGDVWYGAVEYVDKLTNTTGHFGSLYDAAAAAKKNNKYFDFFIYEYDTLVNKLTLVGKVDKAANQPTTPSTNQSARSSTASSKPIVTIVKDSGKLRAIAANGDGQGNPAAFVQFPTALRTNEGQQYEVDQLVWTGKFYRVSGNISPINTNVAASTTSIQNITENINKENSKMNFNSVFEELNKLYESKAAEKPEQVEGKVKEEPVEEGCTKETLKEAADEEEIEFAEEPVDVIPEEETEEAPVKEEIPEEDINTVEEFLKSFSEYDGKLNLEFKPIVIDDKEYQVTGLLSDDTEEGKLVVEVVLDRPEEAEEAIEEEPVDESLVEALATLPTAEAENNFINNPEHRWLAKISDGITATQFPAISLKVAQEHARDTDNFKVRDGMLVATFIPVGARIARVTRIIGRNEVAADEIIIDVQNRYLTTDVFSTELRTYHVHLSDLFRGFDPIISNTPRNVQNGEEKGYFAASISEGRAVGSRFVEVLRELSEVKNVAFHERRGNGAAERARRLMDTLSEEDKQTVKSWILDNTTKVEFVVPYGDVGESYPELDDAKLAATLTKKLDKNRANFFRSYNLDEGNFDEGIDATLGHNVYLKWRYAGVDFDGKPAETSIHFFNNWYATSTMFFKTAIENAPAAVVKMMQDAKARSHDDKAKYTGTDKFISSTVFCIEVIRDLFNGDLNFLA